MEPSLQFPEYLTGELILRLNAVILRKIRTFKLKEPSQDLVHDFWVHMARTRSSKGDTAGATLLEAWDDSRGSLEVYLRMAVTTFMKKRYNKATRRHRLAPEVPIIFGEGRSGDSAVMCDGRKGISVHRIPPSENMPDDMTDLDLQRAIHDLRHTAHSRARKYNAQGEPLSNLYVLHLLVYEGLKAGEIAERFGVSASEIGRRVRQLREEPRLQALRKA